MVNMDEAGYIEGKGKLNVQSFISNTNIYIEGNKTVIGSSAKKQATLKGQKQQPLITIIDAVTATGTYLDPAIIFKGEENQYQWYEREMLKLIPNWFFSVSPNGWSSRRHCVEWVERSLLRQMNPLRTTNGEVDYSRLIVLILDGHDSHHTVSLSIHLCDICKLICIVGIHGSLLLQQYPANLATRTHIARLAAP